MQHVSERIKWIREYLKETQKVFCIRMGVGKTTLIHYEKGETDPGSEKLNRLKDSYNNLNLNWLIAGDGERFIQDESNMIQEKSVNYDQPSITYEYEIRIKDLNELVDYLRKDRDKLKNELNLIKTKQSIKKDDSLIENLDQEQDK